MDRLIYELSDDTITTSYAEAVGKSYKVRLEKIAADLGRVSQGQAAQLNERGFVKPVNKYRLGGR